MSPGDLAFKENACPLVREEESNAKFNRKDWDLCHSVSCGLTEGICSVMCDIGASLLFVIEEGRAASKSPHRKFGYFLSLSQQGVSADIIQNSAVHLLVVLIVAIKSTPPPRPHTLCNH